MISAPNPSHPGSPKIVNDEIESSSIHVFPIFWILGFAVIESTPFLFGDCSIPFARKKGNLKGNETMSLTKIETTDAPAAIGPYSQAILAGNTLYTSGQLGVDPVTGELAQGVEAQARQALTNLSAVLAKAGAGLGNVVKTTVFLADMDDFAAVNAIYGEAFGSQFPARSCVQVARLPKNGLVEIEAIAVL
jgi:2-iminobutanoate/2-iminopropanoate deaminase